MKAFEESGVLGTKQYGHMLLYGAVLVVVALGFGSVGVVVYSPGDNVLRFIASIALLCVGVVFGLPFIRSVRLHFQAKRRLKHQPQ